MRKVELNMNEQNKYEIIKRLVVSNGNKKAAAIKLNCCIRTINRLIIKYQNEGKKGFVHGNRNRKPAITFSPEQKEFIISLYCNEFRGANLKHFSEILLEDYYISISTTTLARWLKKHYIISPKAHRKTKKYIKQKLKEDFKSSKSNKVRNQIIEAIDVIDNESVHPTRPRSKYMGEMIQMDASSLKWVESETWYLHLAVDDATGTIVGAYFDTQETLNGYYNVLNQILHNYGIPAMFYTDKRTVFEYKSKHTHLDDEDTFTQFSYACKQLGIEIKTTSVAQAKGRIERFNQTLQSRLPIELKRARISTIEQANEFLNSYIKKLNDKFALHLNSTKSVFETQPSEATINKTLSIITRRKIDAGHCLHFNKKVYRIIDENNEFINFSKGTEAHIIKSFDSQIYVNINDCLYLLSEVPLHELYSKNFDIPVEKPKEKKKIIPSLDHPWRRSSIKSHIDSMKHRSCV